MESPEVSHRDDVGSRTILGLIVFAALFAWAVTSVIPEGPMVYYRVDKGIVGGCMYVMVPNNGNIRIKVPCESFTLKELQHMGGYAQK